MAEGFFRSKKGFTVVQNEITKDANISLKAKGLYLVIQAYISMPDRKWTKEDFMHLAKEGKKAFDSAWKELKESGYLKVHIMSDNGRWRTEYELLDEPEEGPHTLYHNADGKVTSDNLQRAEKKKNNLVSEEEKEHYPQKGTNGIKDHYPPFGSNGNGSNGYGSNGNHTNANGGNNNKDYNIKPDIKTDLSNPYPNQDVDTMGEKYSMELIEQHYELEPKYVSALQEKSINTVSIVGPTASGKTKLSVELAKHFNGEIVSADSMQIYKGMQIATAKPTKEEMDGIPHHMMDFLQPDKTYSVASYVTDASKCIADIYSRGKLPFIVGGTGLYVDSLLNNVSFSDDKRDEDYCLELRKIAEEHGTDRLLEMLEKFDPESAERLRESRNLKRIIRAIEFYKTTGKTITQQIEESHKIPSPYITVKIGLNCRDRQALYDRINKRVDIMLEEGLLEEAERVINSDLSYTSIKAIGYKELIPYFKENKNLNDCVEKLKMETRRYAKRQITWFKRDSEINWIYIDEYNSFEEIYSYAKAVIERGLLYG